MDDQKKRSWAEVSLAAVEENIKAMREKMPAGCRFLGVVKADAYGHGAVPVAERMQRLGVEYLAVACLEELRELRAAGIELPILILGYTPPEYARELAALRATQAVSGFAMAEALNAALAAAGQRLKVHLKLETGMGRTGFRAWGEDRLTDAAAVLGLKNLEVEGVFTHFCVSDAPAPQKDFTNTQFARFLAAVERLERENGQPFAIRHCTNSGAMIAFPETCLDMVRPGVATYGMYPGDDRGEIRLKPAMELYTRICCIEEHFPGDTVSYGRTWMADKPCRIAVLPIGYADGLHRAMSGKLEFLVNGQKARQLGRICMDMCMMDVTGLDVQVGDKVMIFGRELPVERLAEAAGSINYEMTCALSRRIPRVYVD